MTDLIALAERCENATGPDRELDFDIWFMRRDKEHLWTLSGMNAQRPLWTEDDLKAAVRREPKSYGFGASYTASLDAAMTLVPVWLDGKSWPQQEYISPNPNNPKHGHRVTLWLTGIKTAKGRHPTSYPLALCAAALRARAALSDKST